MSASPFTTLDAEPAGFWPRAAAGRGPVDASVRHLIDLSRFFANGPDGWPDALLSETRRHLAGCLVTIEAALGLAVQDDPTGLLLAVLDGPLTWTGVQRHPHILSPELMAHMRLRAAVSLLGEQGLRTGGDPGQEAAEGTAILIDDSDPAIAEAAVALALAEARWHRQLDEPHEKNVAAIRADLPSEHFAELVWASAAMLGTELHRAGLSEQDAAMTAMTQAAFVVLSRHDEETGGFARAMRLARLLRDRGRHIDLLGPSLSERRYLLFSALAGEMIGVEMEAVLEVLVHGSDGHLAALCKALGGSASDYRHLLLDLRVVRGERDDPALVRLARVYDDLRDEDGLAQIEALRRPAALRAKLAMIPPVVQS